MSARLLPTQALNLPIDGQVYDLQVLRPTSLPAEAPRLLVVAYQPNETASQILRLCIQAIQRFTPEQHELWVIDNNSPRANSDWLLNFAGINVVFNRTEPLPPGKRAFWRRWRGFQRQQKWGSYANAIGLEIATRLIKPESHYIMPLHMDTMPCRSGWLSFLQSKLTEEVRAAGVHLHRARFPQGVLHVLGFLADFQAILRLKLDFFPQLPGLDVGDRITLGLRQAGYQVFACRNTFNEPELAARISPASPVRDIPVFRALDDQGHVIFLHLGRGVRKTTGDHRSGLSPQEWIEFAETHLLNQNLP